jgi:ribonuclease R
VAAVSPATRRIEFVLKDHTSSTPATLIPVETGEEYPRIPVRGKRIAGAARKAAVGEKGPQKKASSRTGGDRSNKGTPKHGGKKGR